MHAELEALSGEEQALIRCADDIPHGVHSMSVSLDGVMAPLMQGEDGRAGGSWREASCGTLSFHDAQGNRLKTLYYSRMPEAGKVTLKAALARDVARVRQLMGSTCALVALADGAVDNWRFLDTLEPDASGIDFFHSCEHLHVVAEHAHDCGPWFRKWRAVLRDETDGVDRVIRAIRYLRSKASSHHAYKELDRELRFFRKNRERMRYAELANNAMGIGSGVVEAANKVLVTQRMKRSGMRWRITSGQAVLTFRTLQKSGVFDRAWSDLMAVRDAAANDNHPLPDCIAVA